MPAGVDPLRHFHTACTWREPARRFGFQIEIVHLATNLPADFQDIAKSSRRDEPDAGAFSFEHGVGRYGGAVDEARDRGWRYGKTIAKDIERGHHGAARIVACRRQFQNVRVRRRYADDIGERAADIDANVDAVNR